MHICQQEIDFAVMLFTQNVVVTFEYVKLWLRTIFK